MNIQATLTTPEPGYLSKNSDHNIINFSNTDADPITKEMAETDKFLMENKAFQAPVADEMKFAALRFWVERVIKEVPKERTSVTDLYASYEGWIKERDMTAVLFKKAAPFSRALGKILAEKGIKHTRQREANTRYISGIQLSKEATLTLKEKGRERELQKTS